MLGNWSLGDYFKETSIPQSFGLLTGEFGIDPHSLYVTMFAGAEGLPFDDEAHGDLGADVRRRRRRPEQGRINPLVDNWWSNGPSACADRTPRSSCTSATRQRRRAGAAVRRHPGVRRDLEQRVHDVRPGRRRRAHAAVAAQRRHRHGPRAAGPVPRRPRRRCGRPTSCTSCSSASATRSASTRRTARRRPAAVAAHRHRPPPGRLAIAAAGIHPSASPPGVRAAQADPPVGAPRRAARPAPTRGWPPSLIEATDRVSDVMGRRWPDVGPGAGGDAGPRDDRQGGAEVRQGPRGRRRPPAVTRRLGRHVRRRPGVPLRRHARLPGRAVGRGGRDASA